MHVTIRVPPFAPVPDVTAFARRCEEAGLDGVGFIDSQMITRDVFVVLAHTAAATARIRLMPAVTNPLTRHVSVLASAALSLDDIAPGRIEIWMGRGFSSLNLVGLPYATVAQMRETVLTYKRLLAGAWDVFPGVHTRMNGGRHVPLYLTASGPKAIRLAGEVADGVMVSVGPRIEALANARRLVEEGARGAGRDPAEVDFIACVQTVIRADPEEAYEWAGPLCAGRLNNAAWLAANGIDAQGLTTPPELQHIYPDLFHAEDWGRARKLSAFLPSDLRARMCDAIGFIGTPDHCLRRLQEMDDAGFHRVFLMSVGTMNFPENEVRLYGETIGPALRARALASAQHARIAR